MEKTNLICKKCGIVRKVNINGMKPESYIKIRPLCRKCGMSTAIHKIKKTWFKKGSVAWNKGINKPTNSGRTWFKKREHVSEETEYKKGQNKGHININWKGDSVGYGALHSWVSRHLGRPKTCSRCSSETNVQWANKSWEYKRDVNDWISLCFKCHRKYDTKNWGAASRKYNL